MAFASIFIPNFMLQAVVRSEPALRDRALAIIDGTAPVWSVVAFNEAAARAGIAVGMTKSQAQQFYGIEIRHRSPVREKTAHAALLDLGWSLSPRAENTAPDNVVVDLDGLNSLFGPDETIANQLAERASKLGLIAQIGVASQIESAITAARGFPGVTVIPAGAEAETLGRLPVNALCPSTEILETLERWGVRTCAELAALPVLQLSERLGQEGVRLHELAQGRSERAMLVAEQAAHFEEEMELEDAVEELEPLSFLLGRLLGQLCARLEARALAACAVRVRFEMDPGFEESPQGINRPSGTRNALSEASRHSASPAFAAGELRAGLNTIAPPALGKIQDGTKRDIQKTRNTTAVCDGGQAHHGGQAVRVAKSYERVLTLPTPMRNPKTLLNLLRLHLQSDPPAAPILKIVMSADAARPRVAQAGLFVPISPDPEKLELTIARIANVVGDANVGSPELVDTHKPGEFRMRRFAAEVAEPKRGRERKIQVEENFAQDVNRPSGATEIPSDTSRHSAASAYAADELRVGLSTIAATGLSTALDGGIVRNAQSNAETRKLNKSPIGFRVFRPAAAAKVELCDGCPARVRFQGMDGRVVAASGPWRSSGDWWREDGWQNDEWDLEIVFSHAVEARAYTSSGFLSTMRIGNAVANSEQRGFYRLFFDSIRKEWFVRGTYD